MQTVARPTVSDKVFYAHLHDVSGILARVDDTVLFFNDETGALVTITSYAGLTVLGEAGIADCQQLWDRLQGGAAYLATHRQN